MKNVTLVTYSIVVLICLGFAISCVFDKEYSQESVFVGFAIFFNQLRIELNRH